MCRAIQIHHFYYLLEIVLSWVFVGLNMWSLIFNIMSQNKQTNRRRKDQKQNYCWREEELHKDGEKWEDSSERVRLGILYYIKSGIWETLLCHILFFIFESKTKQPSMGPTFKSKYLFHIQIRYGYNIEYNPRTFWTIGHPRRLYQALWCNILKVRHVVVNKQSSSNFHVKSHFQNHCSSLDPKSKRENHNLIAKKP